MAFTRPTLPVGPKRPSTPQQAPSTAGSPRPGPSQTPPLGGAGAGATPSISQPPQMPQLPVFGAGGFGQLGKPPMTPGVVGGAPRTGIPTPPKGVVPSGMPPPAILPGQRQPGLGGPNTGSMPGMQDATYQGGTNTPPPPADPMADINAYYQDLLKGEDARWAAQQNTLAGQANIFQRQADLGSARMGRGAGGGLLQAKGAALGAGMREFDKGFQEYDKNKRQLGLAWLDKQIEERRRGEDKDFAREQGDKADEMQLMQMYLEYGAGVPFDEFKAAVEGGDMAWLGGPTKTSGVEGFDDDKDGRQDAYTINTPNGPVSIDSTQQKDVQNAVERRFGSKWTGVEGAPTFVMQWIANNASQMFDGGIPGPNSPIWDALEAAMRDKGYPIEGPQAGWYTID